MKQLRDYQIRISNDAAEILQRKKLVCLFMEVRTGKSLTALETCKKVNAKRVLFITKIKAFNSIQDDYNDFNYKFDITVINRESLHKIEGNDFDVVIIDEVHGYASYPKPSKFHKDIKSRFGNLPMILLSGTPTPESYSQYYHIFNLSNHSPFKQVNFYKWANDYVDIQLKYLGYAQVKDYSNARKKDFWHIIRYYILTFTQSEAGFTTSVNEMVLECEMKPITYKIIDKLKKDLVVTSSSTGKLIIADTGVKLQQKIHQLSSGTVKFEDGSIQVIDDSKAQFIKEKFKGVKIAIFYNFIAELEMLRQVFGTENLTTDLEEFNTTNKNIALQIVSGREGISLKAADHLVFFNIAFSAVSYFQAKDRLTTMERKENTIFWLFSKGGIEEKIYKSVQNKKDYTLSTFKKDYGIRIEHSKENNNQVRTRRILRT
jgi:Holliday junction resolvase-like predicted endonuclease